MACKCTGARAPAFVAGRIIGLSSGPRPRVLVQRPDGAQLAVDVSNVSAAELRAFAQRVGLPVPPGASDLGDLVDDLQQLVTDLQSNGRVWFFDRIRELTGLGVGYQGLAFRADGLGRPDYASDCRDRANELRTALDALYWVVDVYLGGVESLPNVVPPPPGRRAGVQYSPAPPRFVPPAVAVAPAVLAAALKGLGIVSAAALLAYIASVAADYGVRAAQVDAAQQNNNPNLLPTPERGIVEQVTDSVGKIVLIGALALAWVNRDRIVAAARGVGRRGAA